MKKHKKRAQKSAWGGGPNRYWDAAKWSSNPEGTAQQSPTGYATSLVFYFYTTFHSLPDIQKQRNSCSVKNTFRR